MVHSSITGPETLDTFRVAISQPMFINVGEGTYEITVTFSYLVEADTGGYNCSAFTTSSQHNVITSDHTTVLESINVGRKLTELALLHLI